MAPGELALTGVLDRFDVALAAVLLGGVDERSGRDTRSAEFNVRVLPGLLRGCRQINWTSSGNALWAARPGNEAAPVSGAEFRHGAGLPWQWPANYGNALASAEQHVESNGLVNCSQIPAARIRCSPTVVPGSSASAAID